MPLQPRGPCSLYTCQACFSLCAEDSSPGRHVVFSFTLFRSLPVTLSPYPVLFLHFLTVNYNFIIHLFVYCLPSPLKCKFLRSGTLFYSFLIFPLPRIEYYLVNTYWIMGHRNIVTCPKPCDYKVAELRFKFRICVTLESMLVKFNKPWCCVMQHQRSQMAYYFTFWYLESLFWSNSWLSYIDV